MNAGESGIGIGAFTEQHDTRNHIIIVDDFAVFAVKASGKLSQADFRPLGYDGNIFDVYRGAVLAENHRVCNVANVIHQPYSADIDLLQSHLNEASTGVGIVVGQLLFDLREIESISDQLVGVQTNLILAGGAAEAGNINYIRS